MPPKVKVTKEDIIRAAVDLVREYGAQSINARTLATVLSCSTQPIFSNFETMDELRLAVVKKAYRRARNVPIILLQAHRKIRGISHKHLPARLAKIISAVLVIGSALVE